MRIPSGTTDRYVYFVGVDATDLKTRETGLSSFTVYYEIANGTATAMTTPTITEASAANMPGVYSLLIDESGMTALTSGHDTAELVLHITQASMAPVTRVIEIYRAKFTEGETSSIAALSSQTSVDAIAVQLVDILSIAEAIALTGAATYVEADSYTLTTGSLSSGTVADTATADGVNHVHTDATGAIQVIYDFEMGVGEVAVEVLFRGRVNSANDDIAVQVYDWVGADWETLWLQEGVAGSVVTSRAEPVLVKHTGTGANDGQLRLRFYAASGLTSATLYVDQLLVAKTATAVDLSPSALTDVGNAVFDKVVDGYKLVAHVRLWSAVLGGVVTGAGSGSELFKKVGDSAVTRVTATVDASGNRSAIALNLDTT